MKGGLEIWKTNRPKWVKKAQTVETLPKLNVSNVESRNQSVVSSPISLPTSSPDSSTASSIASSPASSPKPSIINISFAVPKKQQNKKQENTVRGANTGSRFNLLPTNTLQQMKWF
jgi:hypothetical protein